MCFSPVTKGKYATNITFQPRYAAESFTENVLFCGNWAEQFNGVEGPVVVTYRRIAHHMTFRSSQEGR